MPIVNKANYVECPSCKKWMHAPTTTETPLGGIAPFVSQQHYHGNRVAICQECYERADGPQQVVVDATSYESERWIVYCPSVPDDRSVCSRLFKSRMEAHQFIDTWIAQSQKCKYVIAEVGPNARAKYRTLSDLECESIIRHYFSGSDTSGLAVEHRQVQSMKRAILSVLGQRIFFEDKQS